MDGFPLHRAATDGRWDEIAHLIQAPADLDAHNGSGDTPLHCALMRKPIDADPDAPPDAPHDAPHLL